MRKKQRFALVALFGLLLISLTAVGLSVDAGITINLRRNAGTDMGDGRRMGGDWTLSGSGPDGTVKIVILFNDNEVYTVQSREYSFRFNTYDYPTGEVNITVRAYLSDTQFVSRSIIREFISQSTENWILIGSISVVVIAVIIKYGIYRKKQKANEKGVSIDQIKIDG